MGKGIQIIFDDIDKIANTHRFMSTDDIDQSYNDTRFPEHDTLSNALFTNDTLMYDDAKITDSNSN